jgi:choline dehydrogenase-like flavoprotein
MGSESQLDRRSFLAGLGSMIAALSVPGLTSSSQAADQVPNSKPPTGLFGDIDENTIFDVCIIGSGFAGAILGNSLVKHGIKTVILESGPDPRGKSIDPRFQQLDSYRSSGPIEYPVVSSRFRGVGGTSWLWGGMCPRLHPIDFEKNSYTPAEASWPISYEDLQPYYEQAEQALRVRAGKRSKYHPPKNGNFPIPPDRNVSPLESMLMDAGIIISDVPYSTPKDRDRSFLSDRAGPFVRMTDSHLPDFQKSGYGSLVSEVTVTRLVVDEAGYIAGAEIRDLDRSTKILRARVYIVACGGLESPRLLLLSRSRGFPNGIGNNNDLVGRFFMEHRGTGFKGRVRIGWRTFSLLQLKGQSHQFYEESKSLGLGGMTLGFDLEGAIDGREIRAGEIGKALNRVRTRNLELGVGTEMKPTLENRVTLDTKAKDYFGNPGINLFVSETDEDVRTVARGKKIVRKICAELGIEEIEELPRNTWAHHHMGTCRMGANPRTSVVDPNLRVHGTKNLFVAGSSVFVTSGTANPTLTLTALALRLSDHLRSQLQNGAFPRPHRNSKQDRVRAAT